MDLDGDGGAAVTHNELADAMELAAAERDRLDLSAATMDRDKLRRLPNASEQSLRFGGEWLEAIRQYNRTVSRIVSELKELIAEVPG